MGEVRDQANRGAWPNMKRRLNCSFQHQTMVTYLDRYIQFRLLEIYGALNFYQLRGRVGVCVGGGGSGGRGVGGDAQFRYPPLLFEAKMLSCKLTL